MKLDSGSRQPESIDGPADSCSFLCGETKKHPDPMDPSRKGCRWARDTTDPQNNPPEQLRGANCYYCERMWQSEEAAVRERNRVGFQKLLKGDVTELRTWRSKRATYIKKLLARKQNVASGSKRRDGVKKVNLKRSRISMTSLIHPDDLFFPMRRYRKQFGSPSKPCNKKLGHKISVIDGVKGIVVPGDDGEMPFRLRRQSQTQVDWDSERGMRV